MTSIVADSSVWRKVTARMIITIHMILRNYRSILRLSRSDFIILVITALIAVARIRVRFFM